MRLTLSEKLETIKVLDTEVIELIEDEGAVVSEIEQADDYKDRVFRALFRIDQITKPPPSPACLQHWSKAVKLTSIDRRRWGLSMKSLSHHNLVLGTDAAAVYSPTWVGPATWRRNVDEMEDISEWPARCHSTQLLFRQ